MLNKLAEGYSIRQLAEEYQISTNTIQRWKNFLSVKNVSLPQLK
ncbi:helix-turn-helix domain-containing protein [Psychrobacter faecalis]